MNQFINDLRNPHFFNKGYYVLVQPLRLQPAPGQG